MRRATASIGTDLLLRAAGAALLIPAYLCGRDLLGHARIADAVPPLGYVEAGLAFVCTAFGGMCLCHGRHILDEIEVSERWRANARIAQIGAGEHVAADARPRDAAVERPRAS